MTNAEIFTADAFALILMIGPKILVLFALSALTAPLVDRFVVRYIERRR